MRATTSIGPEPRGLLAQCFVVGVSGVSVTDTTSVRRHGRHVVPGSSPVGAGIRGAAALTRGPGPEPVPSPSLSYSPGVDQYIVVTRRVDFLQRAALVTQIRCVRSH